MRGTVLLLVFHSHTRTVSSLLAEAMCLPSGDHETPNTLSVCPVRVAIGVRRVPGDPCSGVAVRSGGVTLLLGEERGCEMTKTPVPIAAAIATVPAVPIRRAVRRDRGLSRVGFLGSLS